MSILDPVKQHPIAIGAGIIGIIVIYMVIRSSGGSANTTDPGLYSALMAQNSQQQQIDAGLQGQQASIAGQIQLATIQSQSSYNLATLQSEIEKLRINATQESTDLANQLSANVAIKQIQGATDVQAIRSNENVQTTQAYTNTLIQQVVSATSAQIAAINAQSAVAQAAISNQCHGFSCLF